ncbi:winged helix-turn-helix transcriptional regulator [Candidatus Roizmanbacteria bacterium]|nr:winged helix-turn-helix transcriptional regulator [Candidatus Roizmanbacteria bacterium]
MVNSHLRVMSPQEEQIYRVLMENNNLSAKEIAHEIGVLPHAVHRSVKSLISSGFLTSDRKWPARYCVQDFSTTIEENIKVIKSQFLPFLSTARVNGEDSRVPISISFIQTRTELLENSNLDLRQVKTEADFIVSGLEVPAETMLRYKQAIDQGVKVKILVQNIGSINAVMLENWKKIGIEIRLYPLLEARIIILDSHIVYFTSYNPASQEESVGVRFDYKPIALLTKELFDNRWESAVTITT